jgi:PAS domain S-box-containing protein
MIEEVQDYAIILLDKDGTILNWNKGAQNIKGYKDEEIAGKNFSVFSSPTIAKQITGGFDPTGRTRRARYARRLAEAKRWQ